MPNTIGDFLSLFRSKNLARTNRFQVVLSLPQKLVGQYNQNLREISLLVESSVIPGRSFEGIDYSPVGPGYMVPAIAKFDDWGVRFRLTEDYMIKEIIDAWMDLVIDPTTNLAGFRDDYVSTASVSPLDLNNQAIATYELQEIYPRSVQEINVDHGSENTYSTLSVIFNYNKWA